MILATTTGDFDKYASDYLERIRYVAEAGFRYLDLSLYTVTEEDPLFGPDWRAYAEKIKEYAAEKGLTFVQAHSPSTNNMAGEEGYQDALWKTGRAIEICGVLGIPNMVVHAGWHAGVLERMVWYEENKQFFSELFPLMEENRVNVLCENTTKANMPNWFYLFNGKEMYDFVKYVNHPLFHACWDTGHANIEGPQYQDILDLGEELYAIHYNDNRGMADEHLIPFLGTLNHDEVLHALQEINFKGPFTLEASSSLRGYKHRLGQRHAFDRDTRLAEPPLELQQTLEKFLYQAGKYILQAYECFEE